MSYTDLLVSRTIFRGSYGYGYFLELNMQTNRTDFEAGFELLGIGTNPLANYQGAKAYAQQFKKCSILTDANVSYSSSSSSASSVKSHNKK